MARQSQSWKNLERKVAKALGGERLLRGADFSRSMGDVLHEKFSIECKYRQCATSLYYDYLEVLRNMDKYPVLKHKDRIALKFSEFTKIYLGDIKPILWYHVPENKKYNKFFEDALEQAVKYDSIKKPVLVVKKAKVADEIVYMNYEDFVEFYSQKVAENVGLKTIS